MSIYYPLLLIKRDKIVMIENRGSQNNSERNGEEVPQDEIRSERTEEAHEEEMPLRRSNRQPQPYKTKGLCHIFGKLSHTRLYFIQ
jgi:hypothetical protein